MRFFGLILAFWAAIAFAQSQYNAINTPMEGFNAVAGQQITITWSNPSSGTVSIRLTQGGNVTPGSGVLLISGISASQQTATFTIPTDVNMAAYNFEIIDASNPSTPNFSSAFTISGGTGSSSSSSASTASSTSSGTSSSTSGSSSSTGTSSMSRSSMTSSSSSMSTSGSSMTTQTSSSSASRTSAATSSTSVASTGGAAHLQAGGFLAIMAGAIAVF